MPTVILQTEQLTKNYGDFVALNKASLTLYEGDVYGLVGRNGAGKTTFFKCVMGLARPSSGKITIAGKTGNLNSVRHKMGFVINNASFSYLNPKESLEYLCRVKGIRARRGEVDRLLKLVNLDGVKKPFKAFSMGMKQRLGIAGALLGSPPIVVLDEPINGLDPQGIADIREVIKSIHQDSGTTFIISSHILSELDLVATRFGFIEQGILLKEISHQDLHQETRKMLIIAVDNPDLACDLLKSQLGITAHYAPDNTPGAAISRLVVQTEPQNPEAIARLLVQNNIALYQLSHRETTLEEYFIRLIGGDFDA
jgi:ABC-2 type transport system ATP-binding protein